jgi:regulator of telomere elongation helicase 1
MKAVNQAIGRIIRHKNDYGAILLCDRRFNDMSLRAYLSAWIKPHVKESPNFLTVVKELKEFFMYTTKNVC